MAISRNPKSLARYASSFLYVLSTTQITPKYCIYYNN